MGVVGLGAVGRQVARLAVGFDMTVLYNDPVRDAAWEAKGLIYADLPRVLTWSSSMLRRRSWMR